MLAFLAALRGADSAPRARAKGRSAPRRGGKYELLPIAQSKLDDVAKALKEQGFKAILVEGHTDSRGSAKMNEELSLQRAEAVRAHLISRGIPSDKIKAVGIGPARPIASNDTAEGRANNRRVELVVTPE